jgi:hypothetical protein
VETAVAAFGGAAPTWATDRDRAGADRRRHLDDTAKFGIRGVWDQPRAARLLGLRIGLLPLFGVVASFVVSQPHSLPARRRREARGEHTKDAASLDFRTEGFRYPIKPVIVHGGPPITMHSPDHASPTKDMGSPYICSLLRCTRHTKTRQAKTAQPGSPVAPPATVATSWAAGIIVSEVDPS